MIAHGQSHHLPDARRAQAAKEGGCGGGAGRPGLAGFLRWDPSPGLSRAWFFGSLRNPLPLFTCGAWLSTGAHCNVPEGAASRLCPRGGGAEFALAGVGVPLLQHVSAVTKSLTEAAAGGTASWLVRGKQAKCGRDSSGKWVGEELGGRGREGIGVRTCVRADANPRGVSGAGCERSGGRRGGVRAGE